MCTRVKQLGSQRSLQSEPIIQPVSGSKWVVLLEGWDGKRDTRDIKGLSLLLNLGTYEMFFASGFALCLSSSFSLPLHFISLIFFLFAPCCEYSCYIPSVNMTIFFLSFLP